MDGEWHEKKSSQNFEYPLLDNSIQKASLTFEKNLEKFIFHQRKKSILGNLKKK